MTDNQSPPNNPPDNNNDTPDIPLSELTASYLDMAESATKHARESLDSLKQVGQTIKAKKDPST